MVYLGPFTRYRGANKVENHTANSIGYEYFEIRLIFIKVKTFLQ